MSLRLVGIWKSGRQELQADSQSPLEQEAEADWEMVKNKHRLGLHRLNLVLEKPLCEEREVVFLACVSFSVKSRVAWFLPPQIWRDALKLPLF